jgi:hypothetical protein
MTSRIPDWFLSVFALPVGMVWWAAKYADTREGWAAKIGIFLTFVPVIVFFTVIWGTLWAFTLHIAWRAVS